MKSSKNRTLVGMIEEGCSIEGRIRFSGSLRLNGEFRGDVEGDGALQVGAKGKAEGTIKVDELVVEGLLKGKVNARTKIEINKGGQLFADIATKSLIIEEGGLFHGRSMMSGVDVELGSENQEEIIEPANIKTTSIWNRANNS